MIDKSLAIAADIDAGVKRLLAALSAAQSAASQVQSDGAAADNAGVAALQPILNEINAVAPPPADAPSA